MVGFGDAVFFLPIPFGVMILGIAWCVNVFKYQNEQTAYYANTPLNGQYVVSPQYSNQPPQYQTPYPPVSQQYPQNNVQYPYDYNKSKGE